MRQILHSLWQSHKKLLLIGCAAALIPLLLVALCYALVAPNQQYILGPKDKKDIRIGIVLGAGVDQNGTPYKELQARLNEGAAALKQSRVKKLVVSGDNRFHGYNEPDAMKRYLLDKGVDSRKVVPDYGGRSTYESCERAAKVFGLKKAIIISARSHLSRAIYLCRHFGIEAYGIPTDVEANNHWRRELLARVKAVMNVYVYGERTVLGAPIKL